MAAIPKATRLWGAAHGLREKIGVPLQSYERDRYDRQVEQVRLKLGEAAFTAAWEEGSAMTLEQAVAYALEAPTV